MTEANLAATKGKTAKPNAAPFGLPNYEIPKFDLPKMEVPEEFNRILSTCFTSASLKFFNDSSLSSAALNQ